MQRSGPKPYSRGMRESRDGDFSYLPGLIFASQGVIANPGKAIERACFPTCLPLAEGFRAVSATLERLGRPLTALCGFDLRLPAARSIEDFVAFNKRYLEQLGSWDLLDGGESPLARTNVAPMRGRVREPGVLGFSFTVERDSPARTFVVSGVPEVADDAAGLEDVVRFGETSADALREKLQFVTKLLQGRFAAFDVEWADDASVHLYSAHDTGAPLLEILDQMGIHPTFGLTWHESAPPVEGLELEIDVRRYDVETIIA